MEQKINAIILSICLTVGSVSGADNCDVAPIKKGTPAPCDGFYFNKDAENTAEQARSDADFYKKLSSAQTDKTNILEDENNVLQKRLNLYVQESKELSKEKAKSETTETLIRIGYFSLGVFVTALVARNVRP
jgi:hypothetical protein